MQFGGVNLYLPLASFVAEILLLAIACEIAALDLPVTLAASPRVYAMPFIQTVKLPTAYHLQVDSPSQFLALSWKSLFPVLSPDFRSPECAEDVKQTSEAAA